MIPNEQAIMAEKNFLFYQNLIDSKKFKDEQELFEFKREADYWQNKFINLSSSDQSIWYELGLFYQN